MSSIVTSNPLVGSPTAQTPQQFGQLTKKMLQNSMSAFCGFTRVTVSGIHLYSCYIPPRYTIGEFENIIDGIVSDAISRNPVLIAGDFNAWATDWGCSRTNERGRILLEAFSVLGVVLLNTGSGWTFNRRDRASIIDISFASGSIAGRVNWWLSDKYTHSDHSAIIIDIAPGKPLPGVHMQTSGLLGWKVSSFDREVFRTMIGNMQLQGPPDVMARQFIGEISRACDASMVKRKINASKRPVYWWNEEIALLRSECVRARRQYTRTRGRPENDGYYQTFKAKRKSLKLAIRRSKRRCFLEICDDLQNNPWGIAYKLVTKRLKCLESATPREEPILRGIVEYLFPPGRPTTWDQNVNGDTHSYPPVTNLEVREALQKFRDKKAPGLDCIPNLVLKEAFKCCPDQFTTMLNACLGRGIFPPIWKRQKLVLLAKHGKPLDEPSSFRLKV